MSRNTTRAAASALAVGLGLLGAPPRRRRSRSTPPSAPGGTLASPDLGDALRSRSRGRACPGRRRLRRRLHDRRCRRSRVHASRRSRAAGAVDTSFGTAGTASRQRLPGTVRCAARRRHRSGRHRRAGAWPSPCSRTARSSSAASPRRVPAPTTAVTPTATSSACCPTARLMRASAPRASRYVNPTNGRNTPAPVGATAPTGDQAWGMVAAARTARSCSRSASASNSTEPARTKRVIGAAQLNSDGTPDVGLRHRRHRALGRWVDDGLHRRQHPQRDARQRRLGLHRQLRERRQQPDPAGGRAEPQPAVHPQVHPGRRARHELGRHASARAARHRTSGRPASRAASPAARRAPAEAYKVVKDADGGWVGVGYGNHASSATTGADGMVFRFNSAGVLDQTFGGTGDGVTAYRFANVAASDQFRNAVLLPDGRIAAIGRAGISAAVTGPPASRPTPTPSSSSSSPTAASTRARGRPAPSSPTSATSTTSTTA